MMLTQATHRSILTIAAAICTAFKQCFSFVPLALQLIGALRNAPLLVDIEPPINAI